MTGRAYTFPGEDNTSSWPIQDGATATSAVVRGGGTSTTKLATTPATTTANKNFFGYWTQSAATSGDSRGIYHRHYFTGAGEAGECARFYSTVSAAMGAGGTVNGAHISISFATGGTAAGASNALRATYDMAASVAPGGTPAVIQADSNIGASATVPATMAFFHLDNVGTAPTTNGVPLLFNILNPDTTTFFTAAGTGANSAGVSTGGVANKALKISVGGTAYWIGLFSSNS